MAKQRIDPKALIHSRNTVMLYQLATVMALVAAVFAQVADSTSSNLVAFLPVGLSVLTSLLLVAAAIHSMKEERTARAVSRRAVS